MNSAQALLFGLCLLLASGLGCVKVTGREAGTTVPAYSPTPSVGLAVTSPAPALPIEATAAPTPVEARPTVVASPQLSPWERMEEAQGIIVAVFMNGYSIVLPNVGLAVDDDTVIHRPDGSLGTRSDLVSGLTIRARGIAGRGIPGSLVAQEIWILSPLATPRPRPTTVDLASSQVLEGFLGARLERNKAAVERYLTLEARDRLAPDGFRRLLMVPGLRLLRWEVEEARAEPEGRVKFDVRLYYGEGEGGPEAGHFDDTIVLVRRGDGHLVEAVHDRYGFLHDLSKSPGYYVWQEITARVGGMDPVLRPTYMPLGFQWLYSFGGGSGGFQASYGRGYRDPGPAGPDVTSPRISIMAGGFNPGLVEDRRELPFRGTTATLHSRQDPRRGTIVGLYWGEKGTWGREGDPWYGKPVPYAISAEGEGISVEEVLKVAASLEAVSRS